MAKIEYSDIKDIIEKTRQNCSECVEPTNEKSEAFAEGYMLAIEHIEQKVNILGRGAEFREKMEKERRK